MQEAAQPSQPSACSVCNAAAAKYRCPACEARTCSLDCVKAHKEASGCTGKRDRTAFLGRPELGERSLLSDYRFLEEVKLADDVAKRLRPPAPKPELPPFLRSLVYQAGRRGVQLHLLPPGMERRLGNSTRWDAAAQRLAWHVEWRFPGAGPEARAADARVDDGVPLADLLRRHLTPGPGEELRHEGMRAYVDAGLEGVAVVMKKERTPANAPQYHAIDTAATLGSALAGKVVVEYPVFLVLLSEAAAQYPLAPEPTPEQLQRRQQHQYHHHGQEYHPSRGQYRGRGPYRGRGRGPPRGRGRGRGALGGRGGGRH